MKFTCSGCGEKKEEAQRLIALRISGDRKGLEIRRFRDSGPDDQIFCSLNCAFGRIADILAGVRPS